MLQLPIIFQMKWRGKARLYHNLFPNQKREKLQILGSCSVFLTADPLVRDDSKDWWSSKKRWCPLLFLGFIRLLLAPITSSSEIRALRTAAAKQKWGGSSLVNVTAHFSAPLSHDYLSIQWKVWIHWIYSDLLLIRNTAGLHHAGYNSLRTCCII